MKLSQVEPVTDENKAMMKLQQQLAGLRNELKSAKGITDIYRKELDVVQSQLDIALQMNGEYEPLIVRPIHGKGISESTAIAVGSDWHVEESVDPKTVNGKNRYDLKIAEKRIDKFFSKTVSLCELWRAGTQVDTLVLALLGDLMSGYIHEELRESNNLSPTQTSLWLMNKISGGINYLLDNGKFKNITVVCSIGNHGRTTLKPMVGTAAKNSFEWLLYHVLKAQFAGNDRVTFIVADGYFNFVDIYGYKIRFHHGDYIKYQGGVGGISIPVNKAISQWNKVNDVDLDIFGHWHQHNDNPHWVSSSSLIGYNAYAIKIKAEYEQPTQPLIFIEKSSGKTVTIPMWVHE